MQVSKDQVHDSKHFRRVRLRGVALYRAGHGASIVNVMKHGAVRNAAARKCKISKKYRQNLKLANVRLKWSEESVNPPGDLVSRVIVGAIVWVKCHKAE